MLIEKACIADLNVAKYNPRKDLQPTDKEYVKLKNSIEHFGYIDPVIVNKRNMTVVGGHQRLKVLKDLGYKDIEVVYVDLSDTEEKALNIALNKISGDWDAEKLEDLLRDISLDTDFNVELTGFDIAEIDTLFSGALDSLDTENNKEKTNSKALDEDDFDVDKSEAEADKNPRNIKTGDVYKLGRHTLVCNDSTIKSNVDALINNRFIDVIVTDPPYEQTIINAEWTGAGYLNKIHRRSDETNKKVEDTMNDIKELSFFDLKTLSFYKELPVGSMYIFNSTYGVRTLLKIFDDYKFHILTWHKTNFTPFMNGAFLTDIEYCLYFHNNKKNKRIWNNKLTPTKIYSHTFISSRNQGWSDNKEAGGRVHPTMKPLELIGNYIQISSNPDGLVLDPFGGSGTTLIACEKLGRTCLMMEKEPKYMNVIIDRFEKTTGIKAIKISEEDNNERDTQNTGDV